MASAVDIQQVAGELYGLTPADFVGGRNERAQQAKAAGDAESAAAIRALRRPSVSAWLANMLVRENAGEIAELLALGASLRDAQHRLAGDELRRLTRERRALIDSLVARARVLAARHDQRVSDPVGRELEGTLQAALTDEMVADMLAAGCLSSALQADFSAGLTPGAAQAFQPKPRSVQPQELDGDDEPRSAPSQDETRARKQLQQAQEALEEADAAVAESANVAKEAEQQAKAGDNRIQKLTSDLEQARRDAAAAHRRSVEARKAQERTKRAAERARFRLARAEAEMTEGTAAE
jgi:hypothetical protein